ALPDKFIYVLGFKSNSILFFTLISVKAPNFTVSKVAPDSFAIKSTALKPILCRVLTYSAPMLPNPTIKYFFITFVFSCLYGYKKHFVKKFIANVLTNR